MTPSLSSLSSSLLSLCVAVQFHWDLDTSFLRHSDVWPKMLGLYKVRLLCTDQTKHTSDPRPRLPLTLPPYPAPSALFLSCLCRMS